MHVRLNFLILSAGRDDYRIKYEVLNKDLNELRDKVSVWLNLLLYGSFKLISSFTVEQFYLASGEKKNEKRKV